MCILNDHIHFGGTDFDIAVVSCQINVFDFGMFLLAIVDMLQMIISITHSCFQLNTHHTIEYQSNFYEVMYIILRHCPRNLKICHSQITLHYHY